MEAENRALAAVLMVALIVVAIGGAVIIFAASPTGLPLRAGTVIRLRPSGDNETYLVPFSLSQPGRLTGAWSAEHGASVWIGWANANRSAPPLPCFGPGNGTVNQTFVPGHYLMVVNGFGYDNVTVTQTIQIDYPGSSHATSGPVWLITACH